MRTRVPMALIAAGVASSLATAATSWGRLSVADAAGTRPPGPALGTSPPPAPQGPQGVQPVRAGQQLILVSAPSYQDTYATLTAFDVTAGHRRVVYGPWSARVGYNGFAPQGRKREGDGRTPSGTFAFQFMFGVNADPGVLYAYRRVHSYDVWDDDPSSPLYNRWVDARTHVPGLYPEPMDQTPAYYYGAVIAYNTAHTPGRGSAIFLHVNVGGPTGGCVSLPAGELLRIMRWLDPARSPHIEMGVGAGGP